MPRDTPDIFDKIRLSQELDAYLRDTNPWWSGRAGRVVPRYKRWPFESVLRKMKTGLAPAIVLRGARQVGKTTLQEQVVQHLLEADSVRPERILRVQFD